MIALEKLLALQKSNTPEAIAYFSHRLSRTVYIYSGQWNAYWRINGNGYCDSKEEAGEYTLQAALESAGHCGVEKRIFIEFKTGI